MSYVESIIFKLQGVSLDVFVPDADLRDLVIYRLQCVSEAPKHVLAFDPSITGRHPEIPWPNVRNIGNALRHEYENIDAEVVWETVPSGELRRLMDAAESELARLDG